jgi:alanine racemase
VSPASGAPLRPTWAEIDLDALAHNLRVVRGRMGEVPVMAVVKADAYGHGAVPVARRLEREAIDWLGVALVEEGIALRGAGIAAPILVLDGFLPEQADALLAHGLTPSIYRIEQARALDAAARARGERASAHLKIDSGMGRLGVPAPEVSAFAESLRPLPAVRLTGVFSHLAAADVKGDPYTGQQTQTFLKAVAALRAQGFDPSLLHLANSTAILNHRSTWMGLARPGLLLYGYHPSHGGDTIAVKPVLALRSAILDLREVPSGSSVGYGRTWIADAPSRVATLAIGYADGLPRAAGNRARVLVHGRPAPIVGRVSMDLTTIDVSGLAETRVGDVATLIGRDGDAFASADDLAQAAGTITWEILSRIGPRVTRRHVGI